MKNYFELREIIAESGRTRVNDIMSYLKSRYENQYDLKLARSTASEMVKEMKKAGVC